MAIVRKTHIMKTIIQYLISVLGTAAFSNEKMPELIPIRVITKIHPDQFK
jgi:hypothetical protein